MVSNISSTICWISGVTCSTGFATVRSRSSGNVNTCNTDIYTRNVELCRNSLMRVGSILDIL
ncbi:Uncharacterised protein [Vibrio cholerae]|nr:Uncharacterised protein [Vibrio cholerae]